MSQSYQALVLAAGKSSRFNTNNSKLTYTICGLEMIVYPLKALNQIRIDTTVIVGYQKEKIQQIINKYMSEIKYIEQKQQQGTGHAVKEAIHILKEENILIINGDMPLINETIISELIEEHETSQATISFVTAYNIEIASGYGRIIKTENNIKIIEQIDFTENIEDYPYINAGIYIIKKKFLIKALQYLEKQKNTGEFYITDLIKIADDRKERILTVEVPFDYVRGINTLEELNLIEDLMQAEIIKNWMQNGVRFISPHTVYIDYNVTIAPDSIISSGVQLRNNTQISNNCYIDSYCILDNAIIEDSVKLLPFSIITDSIIEQNTQIGPFAHIKKNSKISDSAIIGNFVEVSKSTIDKNSKIKHLSYIGDAKIGSKVNIGAGAITCNYNGRTKHITNIEDNVFIGSNSSLIAPVTIGQNSVVAAGSVITKNVPEDSLAIARSYQTNKDNYILKKDTNPEYIISGKQNYTVKENL